MKRFLVAAWCVGNLSWVAVSWSQELPPVQPEHFGASRYFLGKEDELLIPVNVLGHVNKPGQYMVPNGTDLISLVAYAGGFKDDAKLNNIKVVRGLVADGQAPIFNINLKKYFDSGRREEIPRMMPDDTIIVAGSRAATLRNILDFTARLAVVAQIYFYLQVSRNR